MALVWVIIKEWKKKVSFFFQKLSNNFLNTYYARVWTEKRERRKELNIETEFIKALFKKREKKIDCKNKEAHTYIYT